MKEYDKVELIIVFLEYGLVKGRRGAILEIYNKKNCEIEICDSEGITLFPRTLSMNSLRVIRQ